MNKSLEERVAYLEEKIIQLEKQLQNKTTSTSFQGKQSSPRDSHPSEQSFAEKKMHPLDTDDQRFDNVATTKLVQKESLETHATTGELQEKVRQVKTSQRVSEPIQWDVFIFQKLLPRVFIFILILGVVWGLKASYDYGIITIQIISALSIAFSIMMAVLGVLQIKKERRVLGQVLIGGSIPIFILTIFAMHQMYDMIGPTTAMLLNIIAIIAGIIFSYIFRSESIGVISVISGILVPYLIETTEPNYYVFVTYEAALYLLFLSLALYVNFRVLYFVATFFLHVALLGMHVFTYVPAEFALLTVMPIIFQQVALLAGLLLTKIKLKTQAHTLLVSLLLTALWLGSVVEKPEATAIFIGLAIMHAISFYFFKKDDIRAPIFMINATLATLFIFVVQDFKITYEVLLITTIIHVFYGQRFKTLLHYGLAGVQYVIAFSLFSSYYIDTWMSYELLHKVTFLIATIFGLYIIDKQIDVPRVKQIGLPYVALLLMFFSSDLTYLIASDQHMYNSMPLILSSFWVLIAIGYMILSKVTSITIGKYVGVAILFFTVAKVVLFDISFMSMTFRAILFIGLGLIGLVISRLYNKGVERK